MKNLIDEIENCKLKYKYDNSELDCKRSVFNEGIGKVINWLEDEKFPYNIITAPKSIKLSEVVKRLNTCDERNDWKVIIRAVSTVLENSNFKQEYCYINNNKIFDLSDYMVRDEYKWLYTLWIAGTVVVDDLKEDKSE